MKIQDRIYGEFKIEEPILQELVLSNSVQRLKGISQQGVPQKYYHLPVYSRYEHSLGVLFVLKKFGARLEEQVAGVLHDISHTCFSHVIDWVLADPTKEDYQDRLHSAVVQTSDVKPILDKYGFDWQRISDFKNFSLLDLEIPQLCADRLDYALRDFIDRRHISQITGDLSVMGEKLFFNSPQIAEKFAVGYMHCQEQHWAGNEARVRYFLLAQTLREAMKEDIIQMKDFMKTDLEVINLLLESKNEKVQYNLGVLEGPLMLQEVPFGESEGIIIKKKARYVDPLIFFNGEFRNLSRLSEDYAEILESQKSNFDKKIKILNYFPTK